MKKRKSSDEDLGGDSEDERPTKFLIKLSTIILAVLFLFLTISFSVLLSLKTDIEFGFVEIIFSIVLAIVLTLFLSWIGAMMENNPHLFFGLGLIFLGAGEYALFQRFKGSYTTTFAVVSAFIVLGYLFARFFKVKRD